MIESIRQGLKGEGLDVSISQLCRRFEVLRLSVYYRSTKSVPKVREELTAPIKVMIE